MCCMCVCENIYLCWCDAVAAKKECDCKQCRWWMHKMHSTTPRTPSTAHACRAWRNMCMWHCCHCMHGKQAQKRLLSELKELQVEYAAKELDTVCGGGWIFCNLLSDATLCLYSLGCWLFELNERTQNTVKNIN